MIMLIVLCQERSHEMSQTPTQYSKQFYPGTCFPQGEVLSSKDLAVVKSNYLADSIEEVRTPPQATKILNSFLLNQSIANISEF